MMKRRGLIYSIVVGVALIAITTSPLSAQTKEIESQRDVVASLEKQIAQGEQEIKKLKENQAAGEVEVRALASQVEARNRLLAELAKEEKILRGDISTADTNLVRLTGEIEQERKYYAEMVREAYRNYANRNVLTYLFTSDSFEDMAHKVANLRAVATLRAQRIDRIDSLSKQQTKERATLVSRGKELAAVEDDLKKQKSKLQSDVTRARKNISEMSAKERKVLQQNELQSKQLDAAVKELQVLIKNNQAGASFNSRTSNLNLPVVGGKVKQYKDNMAEIVGSAGSKVISIYEGKVVDVRRNRITGKYDIYIAHGEYITSYAGLASVSVAKDDLVARSAQIGVVGEAVDIITMQSEHKIVFGIYSPSPKEVIKASSCFKK
ncbi:MAG: peptidoglycan DD-metalloendopeptidase family protein [Rikenellaceae bacterium]